MAVTALHPPSVPGMAQAAHRVRTELAFGAYLLLRAGFTVLPLLFGVDKFFNALTNRAHHQREDREPRR